MLRLSGLADQASIIPARRRALILEVLEQKGTASIQELAQLIGVSGSTVRRDLDYLAKHAHVERSFGGATLKSVPSTTFEPPHEAGVRANHVYKAAIGRVAAERIHDGLSVIFDSSSTVHHAAYHVVGRKLNITAITNDLKLAHTLSRSSNLRLLVPGGTLRPSHYTLLGEPGTSFLKNIHADLVLIGVHGIHGSKLGDTSVDIVTAKRQLISSARKAIVLADASKFELSTFCDICSVTEVSEIITDSRIGNSQQDEFRKLGVKLSVVDVAART